MTRDEARTLLQFYKSFPSTSVFTLRPKLYPLFHLLESFANDLPIEITEASCRWNVVNYFGDQIDFEKISKYSQKNHTLWKYVVRNPRLTNTTVGFVQEDLYARYVGKCNPLKTPTTSWTFIPWDVVINKEFWPRFDGMIGKYTKLYQIEIDLNTTDIIGTRRDDVPWHYLQQTIDWKPWKGKIDWQEPKQEDLIPDTEGLVGDPFLERVERLRTRLRTTT